MADRGDDDSFADFPVSLAELRASRAEDGALWSPREMLIAALRDIDSAAIDPQDMMIIWRSKPVDEKAGEENRIRFFNATANSVTACGMLAKALTFFSR